MLNGVPHSLIVGASDRSLYGAGNKAFFGASVGRCANRIAAGRLPVAGRVHQLSVNEPPNQLHGGTTGFWSRPWTLAGHERKRAVLALHSPDGEDGYPGAASVTATFSVDDGGALRIDYEGVVEGSSVLNLTSHLYFNLSGAASTRDHELEIAADAYLPVDGATLPTGERRSVADTPFDFRQGRRLSDGPATLDHNFCLAGEKTAEPRRAARLSHEKSGVALVLETTECGLQVYDGAKFDGSIAGLDGRVIGEHGAIALEPQGWPNAVNEPSFPSVFIDPGKAYRNSSVYRFETR